MWGAPLIWVPTTSTMRAGGGHIAPGRFHRGSPLFPALSGALVARRLCPCLAPSARRLPRTDRRGDAPWPFRAAVPGRLRYAEARRQCPPGATGHQHVDDRCEQRLIRRVLRPVALRPQPRQRGQRLRDLPQPVGSDPTPCSPPHTGVRPPHHVGNGLSTANTLWAVHLGATGMIGWIDALHRQTRPTGYITRISHTIRPRKSTPQV